MNTARQFVVVLSFGAALVAPRPALASEWPASPRDTVKGTGTDTFLPEAPPPRLWPREIEPSGDGRRTLGLFGANLGRNLVGVVSGQNLKPFLLGATAATGGGRFFDPRAERFFVRNPSQGFGNAGDLVGGMRVTPALTGLLFLSGRASADPRYRAATYDAAQAVLVTAAYTTGLKYVVRRERPDGSNRLSFPSGHTSNAFALATIARHHYGPRLGIPAYAVAGLIGVSRIEKRKHHLSDVLAGATIGYVVGRTVVRGDAAPRSRGRRLELGPSFAPDGSGVGMSLSLQF